MTAKKEEPNWRKISEAAYAVSCDQRKVERLRKLTFDYDVDKDQDDTSKLVTCTVRVGGDLFLTPQIIKSLS